MASGTPVGNMIIKVDLDSAGVEKSMTGLQRQLKSSNKSMGAQLSAFDRGEKSAEKYGVLIDGLSNRHKIQAGLVDEARAKYDDMTATYGENSVKAQQAGQELNEQIARYQETGRELGKVQAEFEEFQKLQETQSKTWYKVADGMEKYGFKMQAFGTQMSKTGKSLTKGITVPILGIGTALVAAAKKTADYADKTINAAQKTGLATDEYQEMSYALKTMGLEQADVDRALGRLNQRMGRAKDGNEKYSKALEAVGISQKDLEKGTYDTDEAFIEIIKSLQKVKSSQERSAKASEIFGTNMSRKLMPAINGGAKELEALRKEANETGAVMSGKALKEAQQFKFEMDKLKERGASLGRELGSKLIPILTNDLIPVIESKMIPALESGADKVADAVEWFANLDDSTKKNITRFGLFVVSAGPVLSMTGKLTTGVGGLVKSAGSLTKVIGLSKGAGLLGALGGLGPAAIGGVAVAGAVGVGYAIHKLTNKTEKLEEVNLDVAQSLSDEAVELENAANTFDKLSDKAELSNKELAELNDLNKQIAETSNPEELARLHTQYETLAKNSGLSKEELQDLFKANDAIIEQSPDVEKSVSNQGNEFAENTKAVEKQIEALRKLSETQLIGEREKLLKQEEAIRERIAEKTEDQAINEQRIMDISENVDMSKSEISDRVSEINDKISEGNLSEKEAYELDAERNDLLAIKHGTHDEILDQLIGEQEEIQKSIDKEKTKLDRLDATEEQLVNIKLANAGINEEGQKGLNQLDKKLKKNQEEISKLEKIESKEGNLTKKQQEKYDGLVEQNKKLQDAKNFLSDELGLYDKLNSKNQTQYDMTTDVLSKYKLQGGQIDQNNKKTDTGIGKEEARSKEAGRGVNKDVNASDHGTVGIINRNASAGKSKKVTAFGVGIPKINTQASSPKSKKVNLFQNGLAKINRLASSPVSKTINFVGKGLSRLKFWAKGTDNHPGGPAVIGEKGSELVNLPGGRSFISPNSHTMLNLPRGTQVVPNKETKQIMRDIPRYANGTNNWQESIRNSEFAKLLSLNNKSDESAINVRGRNDNSNGGLGKLLDATLQQNEILTKLLSKNSDVYLDGRVAGGLLEKYITEIQNRNNKINTAFK